MLMENQIVVMTFGAGSIIIFLVAICIIYFSRIKKGFFVISELGMRNKTIVQR